MMRKLALMIIDGDAFSRAGLRKAFVEQDRLEIIEVIECDPGAGSEYLIAEIERSLPDVILLAIDYPSAPGIAQARKITRHFPGIKLVVLSGTPYENDEELLDALNTGAMAYVMTRQTTPEELIETVKRAFRGEYPINELVTKRPKVARRVLRQFQDISSMDKTVREVSAPLTPKEAEVLTLIAEGNSNKQIAGQLGISDQTIKNHVSAILRKINANYRAHAVFIAVRDGLISLEPHS